MSDKKIEREGQNTGTARRDHTFKEVLKSSRNHRTATRAYCQGNKWATENAKAVGNW